MDPSRPNLPIVSQHYPSSMLANPAAAPGYSAHPTVVSHATHRLPALILTADRSAVSRRPTINGIRPRPVRRRLDSRAE
jgi:hypothetical protein